MFVAVSVYHVSSPQLITLLLTKLLAQETIQTLAYKYVNAHIRSHDNMRMPWLCEGIVSGSHGNGDMRMVAIGYRSGCHGYIG